MKSSKDRVIFKTVVVAASALLLIVAVALAADVILNGTFDTTINGWTPATTGSGTILYDATAGAAGASPGSAQVITAVGQNQTVTGSLSQSIGTINVTDIVTLSLHWYKLSGPGGAGLNDLLVRIVRPQGDSVDLWTETSVPGDNASLSGDVTSLDVSSHFNQTGTYTIRLVADLQGGNDLSGFSQANFDDVILDVTGVVNNAPTMTAGITAVSVSPVDRYGSNSTIISATFSDADQPGVGAFFVTFKLLAPYNQGQVTVADGLQNGQSGMTITAGGGTSYTASISWDPADNAILGYYDLYAEVSDGIATVADNYIDNPSELLLTNGGENIPPVVAADAVFASPAGVERTGANLTSISATFTDDDAPAVSTFEVSFKLREPDNVTQVVLATNSGNGQNGVSISDLGGGIYSASINWDPADTDSLGYWDLYFDVNDGVDTSYDVFGNNLDELQLYDAVSNNPPTIVSDTTMVIPDSVNRIGSGYTMLRSVFSDLDVPGRGAFTITFKVRDPGLTEHIIVNAAQNGQQGLRVTHLSGDTYEAAVLWDPDVADPTGTYDLYFEVTDNQAATATDGYTVNADELTLTSAALLGDGNLLHRTNDATGCGGPNDACHNMADHESQDCRVCHTPHGTTNIYLIRDTIATPNSGNRAVDFRTLGIGDPYNDPDPTPGIFAGVMADSTDGVFTGICEVCHTTADHHRNDGSQPPPNHNDAVDCTTCHPHSEGFAGGESNGGIGCTCHNAIFSSMDSTSVAHRHILANVDADYSPGAIDMYLIKNCLVCHVDHDIFRNDLNPGIGQRARNLRVDWEIDPVLGSSTVLLNSDYTSSGKGGICLSCHTGDCSACHSSHKSPDGRRFPRTATSSIVHNWLTKAEFDAGTSAHNYSVPSIFTSDGSTFNANCSKCHNDDMAKSYQSTTYKFSTHGSGFETILDTAGVNSPSDPLEEKFCFKCHSTTTNPNAGSNLDYYGVQAMSNPDALDIEAAFSRTYTHPTATYSGRHSAADSVLSMADGNRHAECQDCHDTHAAQQGTHDGSSNLVSNALRGAWGVEPTSWPAAPTPADNANVFAAPTGFSKVDPAQREYQICLKCHSNYTTLPSGARNLAEEINPNYPSTHGITIANQNSYCNSTTMSEPWGSSGITYCSDCHRSDNAGDPEGPHGSNAEHLLVATITSDNTNGTPLCFVCHSVSTYWSGSAAASRFRQHPGSRGAHKRSKGCFACHMWDYAWQSGLGVQTSEVLTDGEIFVHGQNKIWNFKDDDGSTGTGQPVDAFCNGYLADVDYVNSNCWSDGNASGCSRSHNGTGY